MIMVKIHEKTLLQIGGWYSDISCVHFLKMPILQKFHRFLMKNVFYFEALWLEKLLNI